MRRIIYLYGVLAYLSLRNQFEEVGNLRAHRARKADSPAFIYVLDWDGEYVWPTTRWAFQEWLICRGFA